jgi:hypothetical protein
MSAKCSRDNAGKTNTETSAKKPKTMTSSSSSSHAVADKLATGKAAKANQGASAPSTSADKHGKKPAVTNKHKDADAKEAKTAKAKHAANSSHASSSTQWGANG